MRGLPSRNGLVRAFLRDERGATAIEYAMVAAGIGGFLAATVYSLGNKVQNVFFNKIVNLY
jgi:pilus assembly protein Flp/PilA